MPGGRTIARCGPGGTTIYVPTDERTCHGPERAPAAARTRQATDHGANCVMTRIPFAAISVGAAQGCLEATHEFVGGRASFGASLAPDPTASREPGPGPQRRSAARRNHMPRRARRDNTARPEAASGQPDPRRLRRARRTPDLEHAARGARRGMSRSAGHYGDRFAHVFDGRTGDSSAIIAGRNADGPTTITIKPSDGAIEFQGNCQWAQR